MESKKIYWSILSTLKNILKNEKLRTKLFFDKKYSESFTDLVNDLLFLESEFKEQYKEKKWSPLFGKAIVNITKEKTKFEKPDNKTLEEIYEDYSFILTYSLNVFSVAKKELSNESEQFDEDVIKQNQRLTNELKEKYNVLDAKAISAGVGAGVIPEVVNTDQEKPNTAFNGASGGFGGTAKGVEIPIHPFQDQRFYPYLTKPKFIIYFKYALAVTICLVGLFYSIFQVIAFSSQMTIGQNANNGIEDLFDKWTIFPDEKDKNILNQVKDLSLTTSFMGFIRLSVSTSSIVMNIFTVIMILGVSSYISFLLIKKPRLYKEQYRMSSIFLVISALFVALFMFGNGTGTFILKFAFAKDTEEFVKSYLTTNNGWLTPFSIKNKAVFDQDWLEFYSYMSKSLNFTLNKVFFLVTFSIYLLYILLVIAALIVNPRIDREKVALANSEYEKKISSMMNGVPYEMDPSLFDPKEEVDAFYKKKEKPPTEESTTH